MKTRLLVLGLASAVCSFGAYTYDFSASPTDDPTTWTINGSPQWSGGFIYFDSTDGPGSMIYSPAVTGTNSNDYEVASIEGGGWDGTNVHYLRASSNALATSSTSGTGSYISVEFLPSGSLTVNQCVSGSVTQLGHTTVSLPAGATVRTVVWGTTLWVFVNNVQVFIQAVPATTGQPGFGGYGYSTGYSKISIGHHDTIAPATPNATEVRTSILPTDVSMQWQGVADDTNGVGVWQYQVTRGGSPLAYATGTEVGDSTVSASTSYTYSITATDYHGNVSGAATFTVNTPAAGAVDPRRTGIYTTGSYWGGGGEQIDTLSGNLNFSMPLVKPQGRTGWSAQVGLNYNSQNWRQDDGTNWQLGMDVGYGYGWSLQIGSITPYYAGWTSGVDHYVFTDGTGAQYRLDQNSGGVWSTLQGIYVWFNASANTLYFKDGTSWLMGSTSGGAEQDAGTMYPTIIQDTVGNQVIVTYSAAPSLPSSLNDSSARISKIEDVRGYGSAVYAFSYNTDPIPHLTGIVNYIGTPETYSDFVYTTAALGPPFGADSSYSGMTTTHLTSLTVPAAGAYEFIYDSAGAAELTQATFPWGGHLRWSYVSQAYAGTGGNRLLREVGTRYLAADSAGATEWTYPFSHTDSSSAIATVHSDTSLVDYDASGGGAKTWTFFNSSGTGAWEMGLASQFAQLTSVGGTVYTRDTYTWAQNGSNNPYISTKVHVIDPGATYAQSATTTQSADAYGNITQVVIYPYNNTTTPLDTYNSTYLAGSAYTSKYILNRLLTTTLTTGGATKTLLTNYYDMAGYNGLPTANPCNAPTGWLNYEVYPAPSAHEFIPTPYAAYGYAALVTQTVNPSTSTCTHYYQFGTLADAKSSDGSTVTASSDTGTNYAAPNTLTTQSYDYSLSYNAWLGLASTAGANGEEISMSYDSYGRPYEGISQFGGIDSYSYSAATAAPAWQRKTGEGGVTTTILDGLGRPIQLQRGDITGVKSYADTVYAPCACSPLAKIQKTSQPYAPGGTAAWTTYTYDGIGRTLSVQQPDGASTTTYSYSGNQTTVTVPAGKWKTFTSDVLGNLITVLEPDPSSGTGGTLTTSYTYDWMNHLATSTMTRGSTTQTRTFVYNDAGQLTSATNPENGTVTYTYGTNNLIETKTDANGQVTGYGYDSANHVVSISRSSGGVNDPCQAVSYTYGTDPTVYAYGRLTSTSTGTISQVCTPGMWPTSYNEYYTYNAAGAVATKSIGFNRNWTDSDGDTWTTGSGGLYPMTYYYDGWGNLSGFMYPGADPFRSSPWYPGVLHFVYTFDSMGRPSGMTDSDTYSTPPAWVQNVTYDYAGRRTSMQYPEFSASSVTYMTEAKTYNVNGQMTELNWTQGASNTAAPAGSIQYTYSSTQNNGQITQAVDAVSGETIAYAYDALKRLTSASSTPISGSTPAAWTQTYQYDGFGNLTAKVLNGTTTSIGVTAGTNQLSSSSYDANGNMLTGVGATLTYDEANRVASVTPTSGGTEYYGYAPDNKRVYKFDSFGGGNELWTMYGAYGEKLGTLAWYLNCTDDYNGDCNYLPAMQTTSVWFGKKLLWSGTATGSGPVFGDRLGTNRVNGARYRPYGDEITSTANGYEKFATYTRDSFSTLDYADQRYYASLYGRFNTPDHSYRSVSGYDPGSWNRYTYVNGDPVNSNDPNGLCAVMIAGVTMSPDRASTWAQEAQTLGADTAYPYQGQGLPASVASVLQQVAGPNAATAAAYNAITYAISNSSTPVDIVAYSGGAAAFTAAWNMLTAAQTAMIGKILYITPGAGSVLAGNGQTSTVEGAGFLNIAATFATPPVGPVTNSSCTHKDLNCLFGAASGALSSIQADGTCSSPEVFTLSNPQGLPGVGTPSVPKPASSTWQIPSSSNWWVALPWEDDPWVDAPWDYSDGSQ